MKKCVSLEDIETKGMNGIITGDLQHFYRLEVEGFWIHFDTDVLSDEIIPALDYRLPGGLLLEPVEHLIRNLLTTGRMTGMSVMIFNPGLDTHRIISKKLTKSRAEILRLMKEYELIT